MFLWCILKADAAPWHSSLWYLLKPCHRQMTNAEAPSLLAHHMATCYCRKRQVQAAATWFSTLGATSHRRLFFICRSCIFIRSLDDCLALTLQCHGIFVFLLRGCLRYGPTRIFPDVLFTARFYSKAGFVLFSRLFKHMFKLAFLHTANCTHTHTLFRASEPWKMGLQY